MSTPPSPPAASLPGRATAGAPSGRPAAGALAGVDFLRLAAALAVVVYHFAYYSWNEPPWHLGGRAAIGAEVSFPGLLPWSWWGWIGVEVFFVISGLVISISAEGRGARAFLRSRALRLLPSLWFFATLSLGVTFLYSAAPVAEVLPLYLRSLVLFPRGPWIDGVYWTLTIEVMFYTVTLAVILAGWQHRLTALALAASLAVLGFQLALLAARLDPGLPLAPVVLQVGEAYVSRVALLTTGAYFLVGIGLHLLARDGWSPAGGAVLGAATLAGALGIWFTAGATPAVERYGMSPAVPLAAWLAALGYLGLSLRSRVRGVSRLPARIGRVARTAGLATYPLYLFHNIAGAWVFGLLFKAGLGAHLSLAAAILLSLAVATGFALWAEPRLRRLLERGLGRLSLPRLRPRLAAAPALRR